MARHHLTGVSTIEGIVLASLLCRFCLVMGKNSDNIEDGGRMGEKSTGG
ncbi:MAG: hypothetical protein GDA54_06665 [Alphaproteobacteria bacterium GM7ARS4]|nr:hypothetical protein [Alphaproteobacteria bacterium GM7ARS4]